MNDRFSIPPDEPAEASVDRAVQAVQAEPVPEESFSRVLTAASRWEARATGPRHYRVAVALAAVVVAVTLALVLITKEYSAIQDDRGIASRARSGPGTSESSDGAVWFFELRPMTHAVVSPGAPVFITAGPERSATLGSEVRREEIFEGVPADKSRLHMWDWSESDRSRVVTVPKVYGRMALSPDGKTLLYCSGVAIELATARTQPVGGFETQADEWIWKLRYSPRGRFALAWIRTESEPKKMRLRVVDMNTGTIARELAAGPHARFLPDEASLVYSRPHPGIPRRDIVARHNLESGETEVEYAADLGPEEQDGARNTYGTFEVVGIAVSADGKLVAVGYYYGQLSIFETLTGHQVSRTLFRRADGTRDTFFQAKLMRFSPDGTLLAAASGSRLKMVETRSGRELEGHYHEATPTFVRLDWDGLAQVILLADSSIGDTETGPSGRRMVVADVLPRVYLWNWKAGPPVLKEFPQRDR